MEILGIGMSELVFIIIIALIVLGPKDMQKAGKTIGRFLRNIVTSDGWRVFQQTSREIRSLPTRLMREANNELDKIGDEIKIADPTRPGYDSISVPSRPAAKPSKPTRPASAPDEEISPTPPAPENKPPTDKQEKNA
jgi:sec-independent protein translocase protein TatB